MTPGAAHIHAHRLLRRMLLLTLPKGPRDNPSLNLAEYVDMYTKGTDRTAEFGTMLGLLVRGVAEGAGLPRRGLHEYSTEEMATVSGKLAAMVCDLDPNGKADDAAKHQAQERRLAWPNWPTGWQDSLASSMGQN